jgi:predicted NAD/FAD-dependent oxidoreductase
MTSEEVFNADHVVLAVDSAAMNLIPDNIRPELSPTHSPILTLYLWYEDEMEIKSPLCMPGGHFHWCFDRSDFAPKLSNMKTALSLVASAARKLIDLSDEEVLCTGLRELGEPLRCKIPIPDEYAVVRHRNATFSPTLDYDLVRPKQKTAVHNLFLAGDWTDTGWPGTMEGAVRSGYICAQEILAQEGIKADLPVSDLSSKGLSRLLFRKVNMLRE